MAFALDRRGHALSDMNITPLVDVMLVLLVIFMIAAPALSQSLSLKLPQPTPPGPTRVEARLLRVDAGAVFSLDGQALAQGEMARQLRLMAMQEPDRALKVDIHPDVDYQTASTALVLARNAGIEHLQVTGF